MVEPALDFIASHGSLLPSRGGSHGGQDAVCVGQALEGPLVPERDECLEQRRGRGPTRDRHADGHEQVARPSSRVPRRARAGRSRVLRVEGELAVAAIVSRAAASPVQRRRGVPALRDERSPDRASGGRRTGSRRGRRSRRASAAAPGRAGSAPRSRRRTASGRCARASASAARNGSRRSTRSSGDNRRIHWPLSHSRRSRSKTAPA